MAQAQHKTLSHSRISCYSQCVSLTEVGRIFSCLSLVSALTPFLARPLYSLVYGATLDTFPGAYLLFTGAIILGAMGAMLWVRRIIRGDEQQDGSEQHELS